MAIGQRASALAGMRQAFVLAAAEAWAIPAFYVILTGIVLWPVFSVQIPGLGDYLNHLARIHIITTLSSSAALAQYYEVRWNFAPYLGMDIVVGLLTHLMPLYEAGRVFVAICVIMPAAAVAALCAAAGGRVGLRPAAALLLGYNYALSWGFLDYVFSAGLAMLLLAGWIGTVGWPRWPRVALFAVGLLAVYFAHVFACAAYCFGVAGFEIGRAAAVRFRPLSLIGLDWLAAFAQALPALWFATHFSMAEALPGGAVTSYGDVFAKMRALLSPLLFPGAALSTMATSAAAVLVIGLLWRAGHLRFSARLWPAAAAMAAIAVCVPYILLNTWGTDLRLPLLAAILFIAAIELASPMRRLPRAVLLAGLTGLLVFRSIEVRATLRAIDAQVADIRHLVASLPPGRRLLVIELDDPDAPHRVVPFTETIHAPMVTIIDRDAFMPDLFVGLTIVHVRDRMIMSSSPNAPPIGMAELRDGLMRTDASAAPRFFNYGARVYWYGWPAKFDDVLIVHFGDPTPGLPAILHRVAGSAIADLYAVAPGR